jgi:isochorismate synthase
MTPGLSQRLEAYAKEGRSFALYRLPGSSTARLLAQERHLVTGLRRIEELNGRSGFVVAPFRVSDTCPVVLLRPGREEYISLPALGPFPAAGIRRPLTWATPDYGIRFRAFMAALREGSFRKLALSRQFTINLDAGFPVVEASFPAVEAFFRACAGYAHSFVYLLHTPDTGTWLGCTPEILLKGGKNQWQTVALAGTQRIRHGEPLQTWDKKNQTEQALVGSYLREQLAAFGVRPEENGPYVTRAGSLAHLRTDLYFRLPDPNRLGDLLALLHPTPAVSGLPKEESQRFIVENEGYDRRYYAGFLGYLDASGETNLYVNLRCMNIQPRLLTLYAGGGLLPSSVMETEWQETEDKLQTMLFAAGRTMYR